MSGTKTDQPGVGPALVVRNARSDDLGAIRRIYNEGIEDRLATLDEASKSTADISEWYAQRSGRYCVVVAERAGATVGWASLNPYSHRCAYDGVADLSVYVERASRGTGVGSALLEAVERLAARNGFHKIVLLALAHNEGGRRLYARCGYREVGTFREQGRLDGHFVDVVAMEKVLSELERAVR